MNKTFTPNDEQLAAARAVVLAMAHLQTVQPIVEAYEREILGKHRFRIARKWVEHGCADEVILDPKSAFLLEEEHAQVFYRETYAARDAAGLKVDDPVHCPKCVAENLLIQAKKVLVDSMEPVTGITHHQVLCAGLGKLNEYVDLTLRLLVPYIDVKL
jgi:hypothetical protein